MRTSGKKFDRGEIDAFGAERPRQSYYKDYAAQADAGYPYENPSGFADFAGADDLFAELFRRQAQQSRRARGPDVHYRLSVEFLDAIRGATKRLALPDGGTLDVTIPPGIQEGQVLRLRGKGAPSAGEGEAGDALVEIAITPHRFFTRVGDDIHLELPVTLARSVPRLTCQSADTDWAGHGEGAKGIEYRFCPAPERKGRSPARRPRR